MYTIYCMYVSIKIEIKYMACIGALMLSFVHGTAATAAAVVAAAFFFFFQIIFVCFDVWSKWIDEAKQTRMH